MYTVDSLSVSQQHTGSLAFTWWYNMSMAIATSKIWTYRLVKIKEDNYVASWASWYKKATLRRAPFFFFFFSFFYPLLQPTALWRGWSASWVARGASFWEDLCLASFFDRRLLAFSREASGCFSRNRKAVANFARNSGLSREICGSKPVWSLRTGVHFSWLPASVVVAFIIIELMSLLHIDYGLRKLYSQSTTVVARSVYALCASIMEHTHVHARMHVLYMYRQNLRMGLFTRPWVFM